ncbi:MAG: NTP transferase domain-containing protein [Planctomycetota bacterium]
MTVLQGAPVALVLAAGKSRRLGQNKLFAPLQGIPVLERVVTNFLKAKKVRDVVVVHPPEQADAFTWLRSVRVHLVENPDPSKGMISSIRAGLHSGWAEGHDFLVHPGDAPFVAPEIIDRVIHAFMARDCRIVIPAYLGLGGHPTMFAADLAHEFFLHGDAQGPREILIRFQKETARVNVHDPDVCFDIDCEEELERAEDPSARWACVERKVEAKRKERLGLR